MKYSASDKIEIIRLVEQSHLPARRRLEKLGVPRSSFYRWYDQYQGGGPEALADRPSRPDRVWNRIPEAIRSQIVDLALDQPELSPRELAVRFTDEVEYFVSEASVYRLLKAHDLIASPAYIVIKAADLALFASGLDKMTVVHRPRLLSDNGASYVATDLAQWLDRQEIDHVRSASYHPQTQGKIERWQRTLKNRILLERYYLPGDLERQLAAFVAHYNHARYHESLDNLTPADVYFGRAEAVLLERERSNARQSQTVACSTNCTPHNLNLR
jgi:putative transposase